MDVEASSMGLADLLPGAAALPVELLSELAHGATVHEVAAGAVLLRQRAVVEDLILLVSGRVTTMVEFTGAGALAVETTDGPGRVFGWSGLRPPDRATATVRADTDCRIVTLPLAPVRSGPLRWTAALCEVLTADLADRTRELQLRWSGTPDAQDGPDDA